MIELHEHQTKAIQEMGNGCILAGDVGSGKTYTALAYALLKETGRDIYVITTAKVRDGGDWERAASMLGVDVDRFVVDSWNNISKYEDVECAFFIFDEQRLVGTGAWVKSFYAIAEKNQWILLSATPGDNWLDYVPVFIAHGFYKNITEFRNRHVIYARHSKYPKVQRYVDEGILQRRRMLILVEMPMARHTVRHIERVDVGYDEAVFDRVWKRRWNVYTDEPIRDAGELFRVGRKVIGQDESRLEAVKCLMEKHPKLIVFYNFDYELELLRTLVPEGQLASDESILDLKRVLDTQKRPTPRITGPGTPSSSPSSMQSGSEDPLKGTIWEDGWDPTTECAGEACQSVTPSSTIGMPYSPRSALSGSEERTSLNEEPSSRPSTFAVAEWNGHKHEPIPTTDRWVYLVQYMSGSEGWNCIDTDAMVFYSLTYSYKQFYQAQGRIDRMNTSFTDLHYYVLMTKSVVDKAVWRALQAKKDFNTRGFAPSFQSKKAA